MNTIFRTVAFNAILFAGISTSLGQSPESRPAQSSPQSSEGVASGSAGKDSAPQGIDIRSLFRQLDRNNDGKVDHTEFQGLPTILSGIAAGQGYTGSTAGQARGSASSGSAKALGDSEKLFRELDKNHDGALSPEEFNQLAERLGAKAESVGQPGKAGAGGEQDAKGKGTNQPGAGSGGSSSGSRETGPTK